MNQPASNNAFEVSGGTSPCAALPDRSTGSRRPRVILARGYWLGGALNPSEVCMGALRTFQMIDSTM